MSAKRFLDTNVLVYAYDLSSPAKRATALKLVEQGWNNIGEFAISVQVLQELHAQLSRRGVAVSDAAQIIRDYAAWPIVENTVATLIAGLDEQLRWKISFWDALILAAARASGATELVSEDFNNGQDYGGIRAVNPF
jgi:predicted nucleic acid-binding protein